MNMGKVLIVGLSLFFVGLKLTGHLDASWWVVASPLWMSALISIIAVVIYIAVGIKNSDE